jgi:prephenate dehydrogenase
MMEVDFLSSANVGIVGLGLMGGSMAMALHGRCAKLIGVDPDHEVLHLAEQLNIFECLSNEVGNILSKADIIILAAPVCAIINIIHELPAISKHNTIVIDLGSTKVDIVNAMETLPELFDPIGGHPMCGKETSSMINADEYLYREAPFLLVPLQRTTAHAKKIAEQIVSTIGSYPIWLDAVTHDRFTSITSHFPYILSTILAATTPIEAKPLIGPGFKSTSRLASSSTEMMSDILFTNRKNILDQLRIFIYVLQEFEANLSTGQDNEIKKMLNAGKNHHKKLIGIKS